MKAAEKSCARLIQQIVCLRDRVCQRCGATPICAHHAWPRRNHATSFESDALIGLCLECHQQAHLNPREFREFVRSKIGEECYEYLESLSNQVVRLREKDYIEIAERLRKCSPRAWG